MRRKPLPRWAKVLLWVAGGVTTLAAAGGLWLAAMLSGGLDDLLDRPGPYATDPKVVAARDRLTPVNQRELREVPAQGSVVATASGARCEEGVHDWKRDDPYDLSCNLTDAIVLAGDLDGFREDMLRLDAALVAAGWTHGSLSVGRVVTEYWDARRTDYAPNDLPGVQYDTVGYEKALRIRWTDATAPAAELGSFSSDVQWRDAAGRPIPARRAAELVGAGRYGVVVELERRYFEE